MQHQARPGETSVRGHEAVRPGWTCARCGCAWPCGGVRAELRRDFDRFPASLMAYMAPFYALACQDLAGQADGVPADLRERFLGWLPRPARRVTPGG